MPIYKYKANDKYGITFAGKMNASNTTEVIDRLKRKKIMPVKIEQIKISRAKARKKEAKKLASTRKQLSYRLGADRVKSTFGNKVNINFSKANVRDVIVFTQNLYSLKRADFNNVHALSTLLQATDNANLALIVEDILNGVEAGQYMYSVMELYPDVFPPAYVGIIKAGELSGSLVNSLEQARIYLESTTKLKQKLRSILVPNIAQFVAIIVLLIAGVIFVTPQIDKIYQSFGLSGKLPPATVAFTNFVEYVGSIWYIIVGAIVAVIVLIILYIRTMEGRFKFDLFKYKMPVFGDLIVLIDLKKFVNALKLNLLNGMRLQEALDLSKEVVKNTVFLSIVETSKNNLINGDNWVEPFERVGIFPSMVTEMFKMGMDTDITEMVGKIEEYSEMDIDRKMENTIRVLPEISYSLVGIVLIAFVVIIMVPLMEVYMGSFLFEAYGI